MNRIICMSSSGEKSFHMRKRSGGSLVFTASVSGLVGSMFSPVYSAAKLAVEARLLANVPMGRHCRAEEVAYAALWLASDEASFATGVALPIDGGFTAR